MSLRFPDARLGLFGMRRRAVLIGFYLCFHGFLPSLFAGEIRYVVKKDDTLSQIAQHHGVGIAAIKARNPGLTNLNHLTTGQLLRIPTLPPVSKPTALPAELVRAIAKAKITPKRWQYIVIHHSGTDVGSAQAFDRFHHESGMENGLAYHFVIGNGRGMGEGEVAIGRRWAGQLNGGHLASAALNAKSIGICLVGNFDQYLPTSKQMEMLDGLVSELLKRCKLSSSAVRTHQEINTVHTRCPGEYLPEKAFLTKLKATSP